MTFHENSYPTDDGRLVDPYSEEWDEDEFAQYCKCKSAGYEKMISENPFSSYAPKTYNIQFTAPKPTPDENESTCKLEKHSNQTTSYVYKDGFLVDVTSTKDTYEVYLYHPEYGIKEYMFGLVKKIFTSKEQVLEMIVMYLENGHHIERYQKNYM